MRSFTPYGPDSMMWRINRERVMLLAGPAAAVLQVAHPQVAMGVAAHSSFRSDPLGRLRRTLDAVYAVAFGTAGEVEMVRERVARAHRVVRGGGYSAFDPDAQLWVLATLLMGSVNMYRRFVGTLDLPELNRFLVENAMFGIIFGLDAAQVWKTWEEFDAYWKEMTEGFLLGSHPVCGEVARAVIQPDSPWWMRRMSPVIGALACEYLPEDLRERLGIRTGLTRRPLWLTLDRVVPGLLPLLPDRLRYASQYLAALKRDSG